MDNRSVNPKLLIRIENEYDDSEELDNRDATEPVHPEAYYGFRGMAEPYPDEDDGSTSTWTADPNVDMDYIVSPYWSIPAQFHWLVDDIERENLNISNAVRFRYVNYNKVIDIANKIIVMEMLLAKLMNRLFDQIHAEEIMTANG